MNNYKFIINSYLLYDLLARRSADTSGLGSWHSSQDPVPRGHSSALISVDPSSSNNDSHHIRFDD